MLLKLRDPENESYSKGSRVLSPTPEGTDGFVIAKWETRRATLELAIIDAMTRL